MKNQSARCASGSSIKTPVRGFSDGGIVGLMQNRKKVIDDTVDAAVNPLAQASKPEAKPKSMGAEADSYAAQAAAIEAEQLAAGKRAAAAASKPKSFLGKLGFANGGKIEGEGTPTSDSIEASVKETGEPIAVSTQERILSQSQDAALEQLAIDLGYESLEQMLETMTGEPVGPTIKDGKQAAAYGGKPQDMDYEAVTTSPIGQAPKPVANMPDVVRSGNSFSAEPTSGNPMASLKTPDAAPAVAAPEIVRNGNSFSEAPPKPVNPLAQSTRDFSMPEGGPVPFKPRVESPATPETPMKKPVFQAGDASMRAADPKGYAAVAATQPGAQERLFSNAQPLPMPANPLTAEVAKAPDAPVSQPFVDGSQAIKRTAPAVATNSFTETGTAMSSANPLTSINMQANNDSMARTNAIRQSTIDGDGTGPKVAMLGNSGRAESQALMDKWGREDQTREMMQEMGRNPKAAGAIAHLMSTQQGSETAREEMGNRRAIAGDETETRRMGLDVAVRGQDVEAQTRAAQLAGNPLTNELTKAQTRAVQIGIDDKQNTSAALAEMQNPETTPERRKALMQSVLAAQGKTLNENRYIPHNVKTYNDMGQVIGEEPAMFDKESGQYVPLQTAQAPGQAAAKIPAKGEIRNGYRFKGGNPADKNSWEKA